MRKSFDGLFGIVKQQLQLDPLSGHLFLFVNKRRDSMKAIFWDGDGFVIWYKRLERGTWQLPAADSETLELEAARIGDDSPWH
ncbi:MAG UNVERIFIED_CONTAM: IS66 family insertion sequence element accessory protein TnpB [Planctomycetaceae bacterium]